MGFRVASQLLKVPATVTVAAGIGGWKLNVTGIVSLAKTGSATRIKATITTQIYALLDTIHTILSFLWVA